jgi:hypothetical protein
MNGRESAVGTYSAYQQHGVMVNRNRHRFRCKKKELWILCNILWKILWAANRRLPIPGCGPAPTLPRCAGEGDFGHAGDSTWMTRLAIISRVFPA